jgi:hypothetical protein
MASQRASEDWHLMALWLGLGAVLMSFAGALAIYSHLFDWQLPVEQMPAVTLGLAMAAAGFVYLGALPLIRASLALPAEAQKRVVALILAIGLGLRLMLFFTEPALEDDYNRYLWEGALTAHAISPYAVSPIEARQAPSETLLGRLAQEGEPVLARVNHPDLRSNYPPVAQAAFALAYMISPWNLTAWRLVSFACDGVTMALLLMLLREAGRPAIWAVLYWWNPIVVKELTNSAHMDGVVVALVLAALLFSARRRHVSAVFVLGLAIGSKLWPALLVPLILRPLWPRLAATAAALALLLAMTFVWLLPTLLGGLDLHSLHLAYAQHWTTNSALTPMIEGLNRLFLRPLGLAEHAWAVARVTTAVLLGSLALWQARQPVRSTEDLMQRAGLVVAGLVLLSPAQFPWYMIWMIPFLAFRPTWGLLAITITAPLYYVAFHFLARGAYETFSVWIVWGIWLPIWILLGAEALKKCRAGCIQSDESRTP